MNRSQDTVIDDDEETCPLCIEEFDLSDKNFRPCPCGYQICQFCFNSLKTTYEKSTCPNCRRPYDASTIQYKIPTAEEFKLDQMNKNKKQAAAKRKETEKREVETSARRNLAGVRVKQQNLVYVIGLEPTKKDESMLLETLRGKDYFGQYGDIEKIVVSKAKPGATNQGIGVYVTFKRKEDAATCIEAVDGSHNGERILRAQFGTTKYCSAFLRGETCMNKNCSFLHETGEDDHHTSLQNEPSDSRHGVRTPSYVQNSLISRTGTTPQPVGGTQPMARQGSRDTVDSRQGSTDASALPPTAGWANTNAPTARVRRASQVASTPSPQMMHALPSVRTESSKLADQPASAQQSLPAPAKPKTILTKPTVATEVIAQSSTVNTSSSPDMTTLSDVKRHVTIDFVPFMYDDSWMTAEERARVADMPPLYDPYGGAKRRLMEDKEVAERARIEAETKAKLEEQATSAAEEALEDEQMATGSLALGGEPEDNPRTTSARGTIGRPTQIGGLDEQFANARSLTPQQRQQMALLNVGSVQQAPGLPQPPVQNTAFEMSDFERRGPQYSQAQYDQINNHQRHGSRYFNTETKPSNTNRFQGQQQQQQQTFYSSGVQGPPPGLPTAGTPPVSGGGMFAHGQGFTNTGFGAAKDSNTELHLRGRSGTGTGHDMSKRELLLSLQNNPLRSPPLQASAPGILNPLYGQFTGAYQDPGLVKQRKKGKKHRHANTSSSGGGVEHLADPSILQARVHQGGNSGQGLFGGNQVDRLDFPPLPTRADTKPELHSRVSSLQSLQGPAIRASTPKVPPGFEHTHAHPPGGDQTSPPTKASPTKAMTAPIVPAIPNLTQHVVTPKSKSSRSDAIQEIPNAVAAHQEIQESSKEFRNESSYDSQEPKTAEVERMVESLTGEELTSEPPIDNKPAESEKSKPRPMKIEIPSSILPIGTKAAVKATTVSDENADAPLVGSTVVTTPDVMSSRPVTPVTTVSEISKASVPRPRTLRLTTSMIQQSEAARGASPVVEKPTILPALSQARMEHSRQPSLSSISRSRPSSPSVSDRLMSQDVSRAGSPPPGGIVGSAPSRQKSKAQAKKDRKEKAKKAEVDDAASISTVAPALTAEEVGPIIARQKKQKKSKSSIIQTVESSPSIENDIEVRSAAASAEVLKEGRHTSPAKKAPKVDLPEPEIISRPQPKTAKVATADGPKIPYTVRDLYTDAARKPNSPTSIQALLSSHVSPVSKLVAEMIASGDLSRDHVWLSNPSFTSARYKLPPDSRKGQAYLDANGYSSNHAFGYLYLEQRDKKELRNGGSVRDLSSPDRPDDLLNSFLLTPRGWVMRHLTTEEAERVQELEYKRYISEKELGEFGAMDGLGPLETDDFTNLGGGLNELVHNGDRHGVHWVMDETEIDQQQDYADEHDALSYEQMGEESVADYVGEDPGDETEEDVGLDFMATGPTMPGAWDPSFNTVAANMELPGSSTTLAPIRGIRPNNINLRALDTDALHKRMHEKHREVDTTRKEMEKAEKTSARKGKEFGRWRDALLKT